MSSVFWQSVTTGYVFNTFPVPNQGYIQSFTGVGISFTGVSPFF
jgi:hypothetical protein